MYRRFHYTSPEQLKEAVSELNIPFAESAGALADGSLVLKERPVPNRIAYQPMEGRDGTIDGCPDGMTFYRYRRLAAGGPGLIWVEACAVRLEGRANPRQLWLHRHNVESFRALTEDIRKVAMRECGITPILILQLTHSGRYSKPSGTPKPMVMYNNPLFEGTSPLTPGHIVTDDYLQELEEEFGRAAALAEQAGFDGVDIKACHRYLLSEGLSAFLRPGKYGGSFENRTRLLLNCIRAAKAAVSSRFIVTTRLNFYDGFPHPYGFGVAEGGSLTPDPAEPIRLIKQLHEEFGMELINITAGNPYVNAYVNRPADVPQNLATQRPLDGVAFLLDCARQAQQACPDMVVIASGLSYMRQFGALVGAGLIEQGFAKMAGFGRMTFAYPHLARDIVQSGQLNPDQCCIACGKCSELMRNGHPPGCVVQDRVYREAYKKLKALP